MNEVCIIEENALSRIPTIVKDFSASRAFLVGDANTYPLVGEKIEALLKSESIEYESYRFLATTLEPDEAAVGSLMLHFDRRSDIIIGIGSGVINDLCKLLASLTECPFIMVATAPSMDGYASPLSSMVRDGLKVSIPTKRAECIIADLDILKDAPLLMLKAGLGDMLAKYVSICEWRIGALITEESYDADIADSVRAALKKCVDNANGLLKRDKAAVRAVFEGLVLTGEAMKKAGNSRPASGAEHYFSHLWDMRGLEFGTPISLHGLQCATATLSCVNLYHKLKGIRPNREKALKYAAAFNVDEWDTALGEFLGRAADPLIELEKCEGKYNVEKHSERLDIIIEKYDEILSIIDEELPSLDTLGALYQVLDLPVLPPEGDVLKMTIKAGKDIRDKYVLPRLLWDLGVLDEFCESL